MTPDSKPEDKVDLSRHVSTDVAWHSSKVSLADRVRMLKQEPATIWLTGLSGSGKSTVAFELERQLMARGHVVFVLDGDNVRHGLNRDLGFSHRDRTENIRRIAEVARLFNEAGLLVITAFISPYRDDRELAREIIGRERFIETHLSTPLPVCESRDPKGLYKKVREGMIAEFTGISAPYEAPESPQLRIDTSSLSIEHTVDEIMRALSSRWR